MPIHDYISNKAIQRHAYVDERPQGTIMSHQLAITTVTTTVITSPTITMTKATTTDIDIGHLAIYRTPFESMAPRAGKTCKS